MQKITKKEVLQMLAIMDENYGKDRIKTDGIMDMVNFWTEILSAYPKDLVLKVFNEIIRTETYYPTIAVFVNKLDAICNTGNKSNEELWLELDNAVYDTSQILYYAEHPLFDANGKVEQRSTSEQVADLYNKLDEILKEYVVSPRGLVSLAKMETLEFEKSRFLRSVPELRQVCELRKKYGKDYLQLAKGNTELLEGGDSNED